MKEQKKPSFYVGIKSPREFRKNLLVSSKAIVMSMQNHQKFRDIQNKKKALKQRLKQDAKELRMLMTHLDMLLPEHAAEKEAQANKPEKKSLKKEILTLSDIDKIHAHLEMIEEKLKSLK